MSLVNNKIESVNFSSFSNERSEEIYKIFSLKYLEQKVIEKYFSDHKMKILDVGCGYGRTTKPLYDMGFDVTGVDIVPRMIDEAKKNNPQVKYELMSATSLNFNDQSFDGVLFSFNGLDFIFPTERRMLALSEISRVLKKDGILILSSHNKISFFSRVFLLLQFGMFKILLTNLFNGRLFTEYLKVRHYEGDLYMYAKAPFLQKKEFKKAGFEVLEVVGKRNHNWFTINLFEPWPYYVLKKKI